MAPNMKPEAKSVQPREFDTRVVRLENLFGGPALPGESVRADLAHADAVSPTATDESEPRDTSSLVVFAIDHEELFPQAERGTDPAATDVSGAVCADDSRSVTRCEEPRDITRRSTIGPMPRAARAKRACTWPTVRVVVQFEKGEKRSAAAPLGAGLTSR